MSREKAQEPQTFNVEEQFFFEKSSLFRSARPPPQPLSSAGHCNPERSIEERGRAQENGKPNFMLDSVNDHGCSGHKPNESNDGSDHAAAGTEVARCGASSR